MPEKPALRREKLPRRGNGLVMKRRWMLVALLPLAAARPGIFMEFMHRRGVMAHALDSRVRSAGSSSLAAVVKHSQWRHAGPRGHAVLSFSYVAVWYLNAVVSTRRPSRPSRR